MKIFLDTANLEQIRHASELGIIDGVTTNPTLIAREKRDFRALVMEICKLVDGPISVEAISTEATKIVPEAENLASIHKNIVIKIPITAEGLKAIRKLSELNIKTNCTLIFSPNQAVLAAKAGATYVSPFIGRLDDIGHHGMELIHQIITIYKNYNFKSQVIVASIRHPLHVVEASMIGAPIVTMPYDVLMRMLNHPLTTIGIERFLTDWKRVLEAEGK